MKIFTEHHPLKGVIVHEPDIGIGYITPAVAEQLLYDDIVFLPRMIEEHFVFTQALRAVIGAQNVYELEDLLAYILKIPTAKDQFLQELKLIDQLSDETMGVLSNMNSKDLSQTLISGLDLEHQVRLKPLPNLVFTRDLGCVIHDHILLSKMNKEARKRESYLFQSIVNHHPLFQSFQGKVIDLLKIDDPDYLISVEGGDVMIVHPDYLLIGISERTTWEGFLAVKEALFKTSTVKNIVAVHLPPERYCMHLDTVFTVLSNEFCVGYSALVFERNPQLEVVKFSVNTSESINYDSLRELMLEIYPEMKFIPCGNNIPPFDAREQWTDGANLVAVRPNVAFSYERNVHTLNAFKSHGFSVVDARHFINYTEEEQEVLLKQPCIITISSAELSRARGGTHCMTLPIGRM
ncbi:MAG TPA: arginine deiminase family protein [Chitinophagales bacterium]|nr:arginine deiminase family protein [Chitinophagales bacterium]